MSKFIHKIAMRCSEQQWKDSGIADRLLSLGYDISELKFLPNMPYVATQYKGIQSKIGSTNTPFKDERHVIDEWNPDLFVALCSQQDNNYMSVDEYFTVTLTGHIHLCTRLDDKWLISDHGNSNDAFQRIKCHKSTLEDIVEHFRKKGEKNFLAAIIESPSVQVLPPVKKSADTVVIAPAPLNPVTGPMSFKEILNWFGQGKDVVEGFIENGEIRSKVHPIEAISRDSVLLVGNEKGSPFTSIYKNQESFLLHALTTLKSIQN